MADVPPEIWALIAQHMPKEAIIRLISVNRVFYTLAMDERYKEVVIDKVDGTLERTLEVLRNPENAKRVRSIHLDPSALHHTARYEAVHEHHRPPASLASYTVHLLQNVFPSLSLKEAQPAPSAAKTKEDLEAVIPLLQNVNRVSFTWEMVSTFDEPFLSLTWRSLGANLQHLRLKLHPRSLASLLPYDVEIPSVISLHFAFCRTMGDDPPDLTRKVGECLSRFINKFEGTLQSLSIGSPQRRDISTMYASLTQFKQLQSFEISPHTFASPESLLAFLSKHSDTLTSLTYVSDSNPLFVDGLSKLELHQLQSLVMRLHYVPYPRAWWSVPSPFFNSISPTLRVLSIEGAVTIVELDHVLAALVGGNPQAAALEEFSVAVSSLSVDVLARIARKAPNLKSLDLRIHDVVANGGFPITPSEFFPYTTSPPHPRQTTPADFIQSAKEVLPPLDWHLQDIMIKRRSCCGDLIHWGLMKFFAECMPTIKSFGKRGTLTIPDPPNAKSQGKNVPCHSDNACAFWGGGPAGMPRDFSP